MTPLSPQKRAWRFQLIGLAAVEVARVQERVLDLDQLAERARADRLVGELRAREVRHLARAAREHVRPRVERGDDPPRRAEVDPERLLPQEVLAGRDRLEVELLVQVVRDGEVEDVERRDPRAAPGGRRSAAARSGRARTTRAPPGSCRTPPRAAAATGWSSSAAQRPIAAASSRPIRPPPTIPMRATLTRASASACSGVAPSCTTDISARVIAAGLSCWITLRP